MIVHATREHICLLNVLFLKIAPVNFQYSISVECSTSLHYYILYKCGTRYRMESVFFPLLSSLLVVCSRLDYFYSFLPDAFRLRTHNDRVFSLSSVQS